MDQKWLERFHQEGVGESDDTAAELERLQAEVERLTNAGMDAAAGEAIKADEADDYYAESERLRTENAELRLRVENIARQRDDLNVENRAQDIVGEQMIAERDQLRVDYEHACGLVAAMHAAAVGEVCGPRRGVVEDVADLRVERDGLAAELALLRRWWCEHFAVSEETLSAQLSDWRSRSEEEATA